MATNQEILNKLHSQEKRIKKLENLVKTNPKSEEKVYHASKEKPVNLKNKKTNVPHLSFIQIITFLGIVGIIIGVISFFFYAVANNWIGKTGQISIGIFVGFILFAFAYLLHKKSQNWSNIVFGGSFFIEYLSIAVGVLGYKIMPDFVGLILATLFLISSIFLSIHFKSRSIAYFTLVGGFIIPFITGLHEYDLFIMIFFTILSLGLVLLSFKQNWPDLRFVSFVILGSILLFYIGKFSSAEVKAIPLLFLIVMFVLYHIAALINSFKDPKKNLSILDSISVIGFTIVFLTIVYNMFEWSKAIFGLFIMIFSIIYLIEIWYFKSSDSNVSSSLVYSLLGTGIITLNLGFFFLTEIIDFNYLIVLFAIEYVIYSLISKKSDEKLLYGIFSFICLGVVALIYIIMLFGDDPILKSSIMMTVYLCILASFVYLFRKDINFKLNAASLIIGGFLFIFSISKYLLLFGISVELNQIILSILWIVYTLVLFKQVETTEGKTLVIVLLVITLLKIAFKDLFYLEGVYRIFGFIMFGILLIIGGYLMNKNEHKNKKK